jgi:hypothetical protein
MLTEFQLIDLSQMNLVWKFLVVNQLRKEIAPNDLCASKFEEFKSTKKWNQKYFAPREHIQSIDLRKPKDLCYLS